MSLKIIRMMQRLIGVLLLLYGIYLIFGTQEFFGTILIILAFLIFPSLNKEKSSSSRNERDNNTNDSSLKNEQPYGGSEAEGGD